MRLKRLDLPQQNSAAIYDRMRTQRAQEAATGPRPRQARGAREPCQRRQRAGRHAGQHPRRRERSCAAQGDAEATKIYNEAFSQAIQSFFDLYRSLQAMRTGLGGNNTTFVGSPTGDFFRYFEQNQGATEETATMRWV